MTDIDPTIQDVSDTALWVAHYRALETERQDALFKDPYAKILVGERGKKIAEHMKASRHTQWTVTVRTLIIDQYIHNLVAQGVDTVMNLGAGLDTRPYRLALPHSLRWIEVDYPKMVSRKESLLAAETPNVQLERVALDLADVEKRRQLFERVTRSSRKTLALTEGVVPYLSEDQVASLAKDLKSFSPIQFWIAEYFSPKIYRYLRDKERVKQLRNAPFLFMPHDWLGFFKAQGWVPLETRYLGEEAMKVNRPPPLPWWAFLFPQRHRLAGYVIYRRA